jgi:hypothetical protein
MEKSNEGTQLGLVSRAVALGMAAATTAFIATSTAVVFTGSTQEVGITVARAAFAPLRAMLGG